MKELKWLLGFRDFKSLFFVNLFQDGQMQRVLFLLLATNPKKKITASLQTQQLNKSKVINVLRALVFKTTRFFIFTDAFFKGLL